MNKKILSVGLAVMFSAWASADTEPENLIELNGKTLYKARCEEDNLTKEQASQRLAWLYQCLRKVNRRDAYVPTFFGISDLQLNFMRNRVLDNGLFESRELPLYPIFMSPDGVVHKVWPTGGAFESCDIPENVQVVKYCTSSCYTWDQKIAFGGQTSPREDVMIKDAYDQWRHGVRVVDASSTTENLTYREEIVEDYIKSAVPAVQDLVHITTAKGQITVTANHPLVQQDGKMVEARELVQNVDSLVTENGELDLIVSITNERTFDNPTEVYNLMPYLRGSKEGRDKLGQIVVAQGFLSGSNWYQNDGLDELNRELIRANIPDELVVNN